MTANAQESSNVAALARKSGPSLWKRVLLWTRTLHIYLSMLALLLLLFFSATGFMMNHSEWFGVDTNKTADTPAVIPDALIHPAADAPHPDLALVEYLRSHCGARGAADMSFNLGDDPIVIVFKGPHYRFDAQIDKSDGKATITQTTHSLSGFLGNLHKGEETGQPWHRVIDCASILLATVSLTGLILWLSLAKRRTLGLIAAGVCALAAAIVLIWFLP